VSYVKAFLDNLQRAGYWRERCVRCGAEFDAPEGEELCPGCADDLPPDDPPERGGYREMHEDDPCHD
jgi:hypothetical protein